MTTVSDSTPAEAMSGSNEAGNRGGRVIAVPWHRLTLGAILLLSGFLNFWNLNRLGFGNTYYAAAVRSMMENWHNFAFNSFDPGGFVTIDKPPLGFWFQVVSAKLFGFNGFSLILPSALAGILSVWLVYSMTARIFGWPAGLFAALAMAVTPVAVATSRSNIIDSILVLFMLAAAWAARLAAERSSLRLLLLSAVLAGLAFNVKMLEAYLVVPALGAVYLLGTRRVWWLRILHLALAAVVLLVVSLSWALAVDLTPPGDRPFVDSTTTNSELDLATGYNGLERLTGQNRFGGRGGAPRGGFDFDRFRRANPPNPDSAAAGTPGAAQPGQVRSGSGAGIGLNQFGAASAPGQPAEGNIQRPFAGGRGDGFGNFAADSPFGRNGSRPSGGGGAGMFDNGSAGPLRLFGQSLGGQAGWLLPFALIGLLAGLTARRIGWRLDRQQQALVLWGVWLLTAGAFFSVAGFFHSYYLVTLAPPAAALSGIGAMVLWRAYRRLGWRCLLLPVALVGTALIQRSILGPYAYWNGWLSPAILTVTGALAVVLLAGRLRVRRTVRLRRALRLWTPLAAAVGVLALLLAPTAWSLETMANGGGGMTPTAGPSGFSFGGFGRGGGSFTGGGSADSGLVAYLEKEQGTTKYLLAVQNSNAAAPYIIETGKPVMSLGGFGGSDPIVTLSQLQGLVSNNTVRFFMGVGGFGANSGIGGWVESACKAVHVSEYQSGDASAFPNPALGSGAAGGPPQAANGAPNGGHTVPSGAGAPGGEFGGGRGFGGRGFGGGIGGGFGGFGGGGQLYDCAGAVQ
ncbi:MAG: glycosyltransferase family 39 protein [Chloroflexota bacterium]